MQGVPAFICGRAGSFVEVFVKWERVIVDVYHQFVDFACRWWVDVIVAVYWGCLWFFDVITPGAICPFSARSALQELQPRDCRSFSPGWAGSQGEFPAFRLSISGGQGFGSDFEFSCSS